MLVAFTRPTRRWWAFSADGIQLSNSWVISRPEADGPREPRDAFPRGPTGSSQPRSERSTFGLTRFTRLFSQTTPPSTGSRPFRRHRCMYRRLRLPHRQVDKTRTRTFGHCRRCRPGHPGDMRARRETQEPVATCRSPCRNSNHDATHSSMPLRLADGVLALFQEKERRFSPNLFVPPGPTGQGIR